MILKSLNVVLLLFTFSYGMNANAVLVKELVDIQGVRENQLMGYGLVVGLEGGTGDQTPFTNQSILNTLQQMGVFLPPGTNPKSKNVAAVMVTGNIGAFAQIGQTIDVVVSSMGTAKSLRGGTLLMTPLKGADGEIYAMAQGPLTVSVGLPVTGMFTKPTMVMNGATIERAVNTPLGDVNSITLELKNSDFSAAGRIADAINYQYGAGIAQAQNGRVIKVKAPGSQNERVSFIGRLEALDVPFNSALPKVVLNARTGSVVMTKAVTLDACAVSHGDVSVVITETPLVTQPMPLKQGKLMTLKPGVLLSEVVDSLNQVGVSPQDLLVILQAMKAAGALHADIEVI
ncbi:MAG: flagellar basal body P-ring protein FlgI [Methylococcales bacterium]|nr:MAG: flagellar basal body P-ring protein FlgI [Methylococcales bacterium]